MDQQRLFVPAPDVIIMNARYDYLVGWSLSVSVRGSGHQWEDVSTDRYDSLTADELQQTVADHLIVALRL